MAGNWVRLDRGGNGETIALALPVITPGSTLSPAHPVVLPPVGRLAADTGDTVGWPLGVMSAKRIVTDRPMARVTQELGRRSYAFGAYCISPLPNDQSSRATSTRLIHTSSLRTPAFARMPSATAR